MNQLLQIKDLLDDYKREDKKRDKEISKLTERVQVKGKEVMQLRDDLKLAEQQFEYEKTQLEMLRVKDREEARKTQQQVFQILEI